MNRYIDAVRLNEEIKKKIAEIESEPAPADRETILLQMCKINAFREVLSIMKRLQQEQPHFADASKMEQPKVDLKKAIEDYYGNIPDDEDKVKAAHHFYELGKNSLK